MTTKDDAEGKFAEKLLERAAAELESVAKEPQSIRLAAGELTANEMRLAKAILNWAANIVRACKPVE